MSEHNDAIEMAAKLIEAEKFDSSVRLNPEKHKNASDWIREQQASAIRALKRPDSQSPTTDAQPVAWGERYERGFVSVSLTRGKFNVIPLYEHPSATEAALRSAEEVEAVADAIAAAMFAPHELPLSDDLRAKYRDAAHAAIAAITRSPSVEK